MKYFIFGNYEKRIGFSKESSYFLMKRLKKKYLLLLANKLIYKIPDPRHTKGNYQLFLRKKNKRSLKQSEIITYQSKTSGNPSSVDIKSVITEYSKRSQKLSETIGKVEQVGSNNSLNNYTKKHENVLNKINIKATKQEHGFKAYATADNVEILNSFNS